MHLPRRLRSVASLSFVILLLLASGSVACWPDNSPVDFDAYVADDAKRPLLELELTRIAISLQLTSHPQDKSSQVSNLLNNASEFISAGNRRSAAEIVQEPLHLVGLQLTKPRTTR